MMFEGGKYVLNVPTDHGKSVVTTFLFPILSLIENPNESHIICGASLADSKSRLQAIQFELETNRGLILECPRLARPPEREGRIWAATQFNIAGRTINKRDPSVYAGSIGGKDIKGRRGKLIMDDIEGLEAQTSPAERAKLLNWVRLEAWRCYEDRSETERPLLIAVGTPFDPDSIYFSLEDQGWEVRRYSAYTFEGTVTYDNPPAKQRQAHYLWPRKAEKIAEARASMTKEQFSIQYRMDPTGGDHSRLSSKEIKAALAESTFEGEEPRTFVSLDPASGSANRRADYAGISVTRIYWEAGEQLPKVEILEAHKFTQGAKEQIDFCADRAAFYECPILVETNAMQAIYKEFFTLFHPEVLVIKQHTTRRHKESQRYGLHILKTLLQQRRMSVAQSQLESEGVKALVSEIKDLGAPGMHDHIACSVWFAFLRMYRTARSTPPQIVSGWGQRVQAPGTYVDREPTATGSKSGWGSIGQYRRW